MNSEKKNEQQEERIEWRENGLRLKRLRQKLDQFKPILLDPSIECGQVEKLGILFFELLKEECLEREIKLEKATIAILPENKEMSFSELITKLKNIGENTKQEEEYMGS